MKINVQNYDNSNILKIKLHFALGWQKYDKILSVNPHITKLFSRSNHLLHVTATWALLQTVQLKDERVKFIQYYNTTCRDGHESEIRWFICKP